MPTGGATRLQLERADTRPRRAWARIRVTSRSCVVAGATTTVFSINPSEGSTAMSGQYHVETMNISEKWSAKKQQEEVNRFQARLNALGAENWEMISYESVPLTGTFTNNIKGYAYLTFSSGQVCSRDVLRIDDAHFRASAASSTGGAECKALNCLGMIARRHLPPLTSRPWQDGRLAGICCGARPLERASYRRESAPG
jgi:hypothetical protein